jgi:hypothetical protein
MMSFEQLRDEIGRLEPARSADTRVPRWFTTLRKMGAARDVLGRLEIFLVAESLHARSTMVTQHMVQNVWNDDAGSRFAATRIVLPSDSHFVGVAALILDELARHQFEDDPHTAFLKAEPLIELALLKCGISQQAAIGLLGELMFLQQILTFVPEGQERIVALQTWRGHADSARDFVGRKADVEVKATIGASSRHHIANLEQISGGLSQLHLLSIGFTPVAEGGRSIANQVDEILGLLEASNTSEAYSRARDEFLHNVSCYGTHQGNASSGYDHSTMREWPLYAMRWQQKFARLYDMSDPAIQVPRTSDWEPFGHVVLASVAFEIRLPDRLDSDLNPTDDFHAVIDELVR